MEETPVVSNNDYDDPSTGSTQFEVIKFVVKCILCFFSINEWN